MIMQPIDLVVQAMQDAFERDPQAMDELFTSRVPCNQKLADHPTVEVWTELIKPGYSVGPLGVINGVLRTLGIGVLAMRCQPECHPQSGKLLGFCNYDETIKQKEKPCESESSGQ